MLGRILILAGSLAVVGCASQPAEQPKRAYAPAVSSALALDPPVAWAEPKVTVPRESRERAAFWGFEEQITTYHYLRIDDRQDRDSFGDLDNYDRQSFTVRQGVSYR